MKKICINILIKIIKLYQLTISLMLGTRCRFYPTCSDYAIGAIARYGIIGGGWLIIKRLAKCHPLNPGGEDPLPDVKP